MSLEERIDVMLEESKTRIKNAREADWTGGFEQRFYDEWLKQQLLSLIEEEKNTMGCLCEGMDYQKYEHSAGLKMPFEHKRSDGSVMEICAIDFCIATEIAYLWKKGVKTLNSCCGHGKKNSWVIVYEESEELMEELGYTIDEVAPSGFNVFYLKTGNSSKELRGKDE